MNQTPSLQPQLDPLTPEPQYQRVDHVSISHDVPLWDKCTVPVPPAEITIRDSLELYIDFLLANHMSSHACQADNQHSAVLHSVNLHLRFFKTCLLDAPYPMSRNRLSRTMTCFLGSWNILTLCPRCIAVSSPSVLCPSRPRCTMQQSTIFGRRWRPGRCQSQCAFARVNLPSLNCYPRRCGRIISI